MQDVEVFGAGEGEAVVEALLHQVHEGTRGQGSVVAVHHSRDGAFGGLDLNGCAPQQPGQRIKVAGDGEREITHQQGLQVPDGAQGCAAVVQEAITVRTLAAGHQGVHLGLQGGDQALTLGLFGVRKARHDGVSPGAE